MEESQIMENIASELMIPVPWGHISGKVWGSLNAPIVLCLHGIQDNLNTFNNLIPLLSPSFCYIGIDLPGHGHSSHFPQGMVFSLLEYVMALLRVVNHLKLKKFILMGHSLGGQIGILYTSFYPQQIIKLVVLDAIMPYRHTQSSLADLFTNLYSNLLKLEEKQALGSPPVYSEEEALRRLTEGRPSTLTIEAAQALFSRGVIKSEEGYRFSADQRLKLRSLMTHSKEEVLELIHRIRCPVFLLRASETEDAGSHYVNSDFENAMQESLGDNYQYKLVEGSHDVHLNNPQCFSDDLIKFLNKQQSSL